MLKISDLPVKPSSELTGNERILINDGPAGGERAKTTRIGALLDAAIAPAKAQMADQLGQATASAAAAAADRAATHADRLDVAADREATELAALTLSTWLNAIAPFDHAQELAPAEVDVGPFDALYVGTPGAVTLVQANGAELIFSDCFAGQVISARFVRVRSNPQTTAGALVALARAAVPFLGGTEMLVPLAPADVDFGRGPAVSLFVGGAGDVAVKMADGSLATFRNVPASLRLPIRALRLRAATTATNVLGGFQ